MNMLIIYYRCGYTAASKWETTEHANGYRRTVNGVTAEIGNKAPLTTDRANELFIFCVVNTVLSTKQNMANTASWDILNIFLVFYGIYSLLYNVVSTCM